MQESGNFAKTLGPALISCEFPEERAAEINGVIFSSSTTSSGDAACDNFVREEILKERQRLAVGASVSRRFGLWQKNKYRRIDDYLGSLVNATCSIHESPFLHTVDMSGAVDGNLV